jgi:predicted small integral membrane protein
MILIRLAKIALVVAAGLFCVLVGYNNIVDYSSNYLFVQHVLSMDTVFPDNAVRGGRAIIDPQLHRAAYGIIIGVELGAGILCLLGALRLLFAIAAPAPRFAAAKTIAIIGLVSAMFLWFFGFLVVGGEWFQMWQSQMWNGQEAAFRFLGSIGLILVFLVMEDLDRTRAPLPRHRPIGEPQDFLIGVRHEDVPAQASRLRVPE